MPLAISGRTPTQGPRCTGCPVCEESGSFSPSISTDTLHRENTSPLGFFSFIIGISWTICGLKHHALDRKERTRERTQEGNRRSGEIL